MGWRWGGSPITTSAATRRNVVIASKYKAHTTLHYTTRHDTTLHDWKCRTRSTLQVHSKLCCVVLCVDAYGHAGASLSFSLRPSRRRRACMHACMPFLFFSPSLSFSPLPLAKSLLLLLLLLLLNVWNGWLPKNWPATHQDKVWYVFRTTITTSTLLLQYT